MRSPKQQRQRIAPGTAFHQNSADEKIISRILSASPFKYLSFLFQPLPDRLVLRVLPEVNDYQQKFSSDCIQYWRSELCYHNSMIRRGVRMDLGLVGTLSNLEISSVDSYLLRFRCLDIAKALDSIFCFAKRMLPKIAKSPSAPFWRASGAVVITRDSWDLFLEEVARLIDELGHSGRAFRPDQRPDYPYLLSSAIRITELFGKGAINSR